MKKIILCIALLFPHVAQAIFPIDYLRPYNDNLFRPVTYAQTWSLDAIIEHSFNPEGHTEAGCEVNFLQICQPTQSSLAMVKGFDSNSEIGMLSQQFTINDDDGVRGHFEPCADFDLNSALISGRYYFPQGFNIVASLPVYSLKISDVTWVEQTKSAVAADFLVKELLTDDIDAKLAELGCLTIRNFEDTSVGDFYLGMQWMRDFPQFKEWIKNVRLNIYGGMTFPTASECTLNDALAIPFGNDGAFGILFGGGIDLTLGCHVRAGVDTMFLNLFGSSQERRIKTFDSQTDLFLLQTALVRKEFGFTQRYNMYLELFGLGGLSVKAAYQHMRHNDDKLTAFSYCYSDLIANTACSLREWTLHDFYFFVNFDSGYLYPDAAWQPFVSLWYKLPHAGHHSIGTHGVGGTIWFNY
ncbi:MAG: hypothetical protein WD068_01745 [Candidatus Babeliales bacterium]